MTKDELAARLTGREYMNEITKDEEAEAKAAGLVVVFGASDDNVELRGAIHDEVGAYDGTTFRISRDGHALIDWDSLDKDDEAEVKRYFEHKRQSAEIEALWSPREPACSWAYRTDLPHATFDVMEDGDLYCRGIVFALSDIRSA